MIRRYALRRSRSPFAFSDVPVSVEARLKEILGEIDGIARATGNLDLAAYRESWMARRAVERGLSIISEASRFIPEEMKARQSSVPWAQVAAIGNVLRHEYGHVEDIIVWNIATERLESLKHAVESLIAEMG